MFKFLLKSLVFCAVLVGAGAVAASKFMESVAKGADRTLLEQTAVYPSAWRSHELNVTYGAGGGPLSLKHNHTHNAQGFKYPRDIAKEKGQRTIRVFAMGGSTLYGWGSEGLPQYGNWMHLANDQTITFALEELLNAAIKAEWPNWNVEVINAAVIDYNSAFHLVYYNQKIWQYHPDVLIFLDGNNEFYGIKPFNSFDEYKNTAVNIVDSFNARYPNFTLYVVSRYLAQYSQYFRSIQFTALNKWLEVEAPTVNKIYELPKTFDNFDALYDARAQLFLRTYSQLKAAADFDKLEYGLFLGPQMMLENEALLGKEDLRTRSEVFKGMATDVVYRPEFMERVRQKLPAYFASINMPFYDVSRLGAEENKDKGLYIDYTHVTPSGAKVVAGKMFEPTLAMVKRALAKRQPGGAAVSAGGASKAGALAGTSQE